MCGWMNANGNECRNLEQENRANVERREKRETQQQQGHANPANGVCARSVQSCHCGDCLCVRASMQDDHRIVSRCARL